MQRHRQTFEAELAAIREELVRLGVRPRESPAKVATCMPVESTVIPSTLMTAAYEMAGYAVATLALDRSTPETIALKEDNEYDLGKCTESELDTIWTVGHIVGELSRSNGCSGEQGLIAINVEIERSIANEMNPTPGAQAILNENWSAIERVARLLIERGILSRSELERAVFQSDEEGIFENSPFKLSL
jgi:hypothetical protein